MGPGAFRPVHDLGGRPLDALGADAKTRRARGRPGAGFKLDHYRALFEFAPDGYLTTDGAGKIREANRAAGALLHVRQSELPRSSLARFIAPHDRDRFRARLTALRRARRPGVEELTIRLQPAAGDSFDGALTGARLAVDRGVSLAWSLRDIRRRTRAERKLKESEQRYLSLYRQMLTSRDELRSLAARSFHVREEESRRIARELHDEAGQMTASIHLALAEIAGDLPSGARGRLDSVRGLLDDLEERLRRLSHELRPTILDDLGLGPALQFLAKGFGARTGISVAVEATTRSRFDALVETAIYRIVQEALTNIARHALARRASIRLSHDAKALRCSIRDDGTGLQGDPFARGPADRRGTGLLGIRERLDALGGKLRLRSHAGIGTELLVTIPARSGA